MIQGGTPVLRAFFRTVSVLFCGVILLFAVELTAFAAEPARKAENISGRTLVEKQKGFTSVNMLFDGRTKEPVRFRNNTELTLAHEKGIGSLYLIFDVEYGEYTVTNLDTQETYKAGEDQFLHEFLDLEGIFGDAPKQVMLSFTEGNGILNELYAFTAGQTPDFVQKWQQPVEGKTDIVLFSTHGDDEQLFFAGIIPDYGVERGCQVQVVYMTGHRNMSMRRSHEMLDGLWAVGMKTYPVFGEFGDFNTRSKEETYRKYQQKGIGEEDILSFVVEQIRRFRPKVAIGHDLEGEYGHGMHMVYAEQLCRAVEISGQKSEFPDSAEKYGVWDVPKTYLHLYPDNPIIMDWDQPLESFDGMTAFEVTKELGFPCHESQQSYYSWYFNGMKTAADIKQYSPREYGLFRSTVGDDVSRNDFLENVPTHKEEVILREEAARREAEEAERAAEEAEKRYQEALAFQQAEQEYETKGQFYGWVPTITVLILVLMLATALLKTALLRKK